MMLYCKPCARSGGLPFDISPQPRRIEQCDVCHREMLCIEVPFLRLPEDREKKG
jgi:hypothetical protein